MEVIKSAIPGLLIIRPAVYSDDRGSFQESFNRKRFAEIGITEEFVQDNQSVSKANVLRGLHFQAPPFAQAKLVRVTRGSALDVAVDIRKGSPTYGKSELVLLNAENNISFFIPAGFAHGFVALEDETVFQYKCSAYYDKSSEGCIIWNDSDLSIDWKVKSPLLSPKDEQGLLFSELKSPFTF